MYSWLKMIMRHDDIGLFIRVPRSQAELTEWSHLGWRKWPWPTTDAVVLGCPKKGGEFSVIYTGPWPVDFKELTWQAEAYGSKDLLVFRGNNEYWNRYNERRVVALFSNKWMTFDPKEEIEDRKKRQSKNSSTTFDEHRARLDHLEQRMRSGEPDTEGGNDSWSAPVSYTHLRAHET